MNFRPTSSMFVMAIWDLTAKFNSRQYFRLYRNTLQLNTSPVLVLALHQPARPPPDPPLWGACSAAAGALQDLRSCHLHHWTEAEPPAHLKQKHSLIVMAAMVNDT